MTNTINALFTLLLSALCCAVPVFQVKAQELTIAYGLDNYNFQQIFDAFSRQSGITLSVKQFDNNDLKSSLLQSANMQKLPDVVIVPSDFIGLTELNFATVPRDWINSELSKESLASVQLNAQYKGIPIIYGNHLLLYYNKKLISNPAQSWQMLLPQQQELAKGVELISWNYSEMYWFIPFLGAFSDFPFSEGEVTLNTKGMIAALAWYRSFSDQGIVDKDCDYSCNQAKFNSGKLAYIINGSWAYHQYKDELGGDLGIAMLPTYQGKSMTPYFSSHVLAFPNNSIASSSGKTKAIQAFADYLQSEQAQLAIWQQMRSLPSNSKVKQQIIDNADANVAVILQQLYHSEPMPSDRDMAIVWEAMLKGMNRYLADILDNEKAAEYMQYIAKRSANSAK